MALPRTTQGIALLVLGFLITLGAAAAWNVCASFPTVNGVAPDCTAPAVFVVVGVVFLLIGIGVLVASAMGARTTIYPATDPAVPPPLIQPVVIQQTVVQQTVEVRCRYCQSLNPVTATKCSACGAAL